MRRDQTIVERPERAFGRQRFALKDVEARRPERSVTQRALTISRSF